jgi:hypothetical protein
MTSYRLPGNLARLQARCGTPRDHPAPFPLRYREEAWSGAGWTHPEVPRRVRPSIRSSRRSSFKRPESTLICKRTSPSRFPSCRARRPRLRIVVAGARNGGTTTQHLQPPTNFQRPDRAATWPTPATRGRARRGACGARGSVRRAPWSPQLPQSFVCFGLGTRFFLLLVAFRSSS